MEHAKARIVLGTLLLICLAIGLIIFAVLTRKIIKTVENLENLEEEEHDEHRNKTTDSENQHFDNSIVEVTTQTLTTTTLTTMSITTSISTTQSAPDYVILLNNDTEGASGKVYIESAGKRGFICSDDFDNNDAVVVCREKVYKQGFSYTLLMSPEYQRYTRDEPIMSNLQCTGNETKLHECPGFSLDENATESCTGFAMVLCYNDIPYKFRLVNSFAPDSGQIEMFVDGKWGTFCAIHTFDETVATLVCREMNYTGGLALHRGTGGPANKTIVWVPWISCYGHESPRTLFDCDLVLHPVNIPYDYYKHWNNRYRNMYYACIDKSSPYAPAVQCYRT